MKILKVRLSQIRAMKNLSFLLTAGAVIFFLLNFAAKPVENQINNQATVSASTNPFEELKLSARAVYVFDLSAGRVLFRSHSEAQLPLASLAKLLTSLIALDLADDPRERVYISEEALIPEGENGLIAGDRWEISELAAFSLLASSNDAAEALALFAQTESGLEFTRLAQDFVGQLNLRQTYLLNPTGLDVSESLAGAYGSAEDVAAVLAYAFEKYPSVLSQTALAETVFRSLSGREYEVRNINQEAAKWPLVLASKTGFTDLAGGNLALIFEAGPARPIISVVLGGSAENRFTDTKLIMETVLNLLSQENASL